MIIADTSGLLAFFNTAEPMHDHARRIVGEAEAPLVVSPFVVAELDYLVATRIGVQAELAVLRELASGAYLLPSVDAGFLDACASVVGTYDDQSIGVADASLVVLAELYDTNRIMTLDHRHFTVLRGPRGQSFELLPG